MQLTIWGFHGTHPESLHITTFHGSLILLEGSDPLTFPYFTQCFEQISLICTEVARVNVRRVSLDQSVGPIRRQATRCTCLTRCRVFLKIHALLSLRHQQTGTDVEVAARLHKVSTPAIARVVSLQAGKSSSRRITPPVQPVFTAVPSQPTTVSSLRSVLPTSAVVITSTMLLLEEPTSGVTWQYFE